MGGGGTGSQERRGSFAIAFFHMISHQLQQQALSRFRLTIPVAKKTNYTQGLLLK
jgi:hypothetical protein